LSKAEKVREEGEGEGREGKGREGKGREGEGKVEKYLFPKI
jgi:hypothetical protein